MNRALVLVLLGGLAALVFYSLHLAANRIYQVDECAEVYTATLVAKGQGKAAAGSFGLLQFPLSWLARGATRSADLFTSARFIMVEIFWLNVVLLTLATGEKLRSLRGLIALVGAATLAPLWDYGFEIRHDNLLLTGLLMTWCLVRVHPLGVQSYLLAGALAVSMQFAAHKAFAYVIPLSLAVLAFPPPGHRQARWKLCLAWAGGALTALVALKLVYGLHDAGGLGASSGSGVSFVSKAVVGESRFWPIVTLARLLSQTPLLLALLVAAAAVLFGFLRLRGRAAFTWEGSLPEALLFAGTFGVLVINPTPFPYNLLHLVPYMFLFAYRYATGLASEMEGRYPLRLVAVMVLVFTHLVPFGVATARHLLWPNNRQTYLMRLAEDLTDANKDPVYDGVCMVPTRPTIHPEAFLHSLTVQKLLQENGPRLRDMLAARPAAAFIPNYRTDWLTAEDHDYVREHYVSLADDFRVLGKVLPPGGGEFEIIHPGNYRIDPIEASRLAGTVTYGKLGLVVPPTKTNCVGDLDGVPLTDALVELTVGKHRIETTSDCQPTVVWVGPRLKRLPFIGEGDHRRLFYNWY